MARNRRNTRRITSIKDVLNMKTFLTIVGILILVIIISLGINQYRIYQDKEAVAKQEEELNKQTQEVFARINSSITETNKNISEADVIIKMSAVGDILCSEEMLKDAYNEEKNTYNFSSMFGNVSNYIDDADIIMGTMETGIVDESYSNTRAPKEFAQAVKESGVNLVSISHNHSLDNGLEGLKETKDNLENIGFDVIGDKFNSANSVEIKEVKNTKIAFLTYTCFIDNEKSKTKEELNCVSLYSEEQAKKDIKYAKENGAEYICVLMHWGDAISETINDEQKEVADFLVDNGVNIILGSHPSVVQPMEVRKNNDGKNVFIAYSIGTYISTLSTEDARTELVLNIELRKSGKDGQVYLNKIDYTPIYMLDNGTNAQNRFCLVEMKSAINSYSEGNAQSVTRENYDKLVAGLKKLNERLEIQL